jgi:hypothetical protein
VDAPGGRLAHEVDEHELGGAAVVAAEEQQPGAPAAHQIGPAAAAEAARPRRVGVHAPRQPVAVHHVARPLERAPHRLDPRVERPVELRVERIGQHDHHRPQPGQPHPRLRDGVGAPLPPGDIRRAGGRRAVRGGLDAPAAPDAQVLRDDRAPGLGGGVRRQPGHGRGAARDRGVGAPHGRRRRPSGRTRLGGLAAPRRVGGGVGGHPRGVLRGDERRVLRERLRLGDRSRADAPAAHDRERRAAHQPLHGG